MCDIYVHVHVRVCLHVLCAFCAGVILVLLISLVKYEFLN